MGQVVFTVDRRLPLPPSRVWDALIDWPGHGSWVPATRVRMLAGDGGPGTTFVARTGIGPVGFDDTMTVTELDEGSRRAVVRKIGPILTGTAGFTVTPDDGGCRLHWFEDVHVPGLPSLLVPIVRGIARASFGHALGRLRRTLT